MTLHDDLVAAVTARLELARAAQVARPGPWRATPTHVYGEPDGGQRILAEEPTPTGCVSRMVVDVPLHPVDSKARHAVPVDLTAHIAANDPSAVIRACEADLERLAVHQPCTTGCALHLRPMTCHYCDAGSLRCPEILRITHVYVNVKAEVA